ncbi:MAG: carbohydrate-binding family 9-like protein [Candidatus Dadabacteria bacterium]
MNTYTAKFIVGLLPGEPLDSLSKRMDELERAPIGNVPWPEFSYQPMVSFALAYDVENIYLKYYVEEHATRAIYTEIHDPVFKDSCVEFFVRFGKESSYYNLEFNCLGVCLGGYRTGRESKTIIAAELLRKIKSITVFDRNPGEAFENKWQITLMIPLSSFCYSNIGNLKGENARANFYKCGDDLPQPHYLSWSPVDTPQPDFHRPEFFGVLQFR